MNVLLSEIEQLLQHQGKPNNEILCSLHLIALSLGVITEVCLKGVMVAHIEKSIQMLVALQLCALGL